LQQLDCFTGTLLEQFGPQHAVVGHTIVDGTLMLNGRSRIIRIFARRRMTTYVLITSLTIPVKQSDSYFSSTAMLMVDKRSIVRVHQIELHSQNE
jgi:hypothetical protein